MESTPVAGERLQDQPAGRRAPGVGEVQHVEEDLEERRARQVALRLQLLDQLLERDVLVGIGAEGGLARPAQQLAAGRAARRGRRAAPGC